MSHKSNKKTCKNKKIRNDRETDYFDSSKDENSNTNSSDEDSSSDFTNISDEDKESLLLLMLQLKAILIDYYGETLLWNSTMQGISYILEKYDGIEGNEHSTTWSPDIVALQSVEAFLAAKIVFTYIAFTRFNIVSKKKAEGKFKYSLQPNYDINTASILNLVVSYYYMRASEGILARDNTQPVFGL